MGRSFTEGTFLRITELANRPEDRRTITIPLGKITPLLANRIQQEVRARFPLLDEAQAQNFAEWRKSDMCVADAVRAAYPPPPDPGEPWDPGPWCFLRDIPIKIEFLDASAEDASQDLPANILDSERSFNDNKKRLLPKHNGDAWRYGLVLPDLAADPAAEAQVNALYFVDLDLVPLYFVVLIHEICTSLGKSTRLEEDVLLPYASHDNISGPFASSFSFGTMAVLLGQSPYNFSEAEQPGGELGADLTVPVEEEGQISGTAGAAETASRIQGNVTSEASEEGRSGSGKGGTSMYEPELPELSPAALSEAQTAHFFIKLNRSTQLKRSNTLERNGFRVVWNHILPSGARTVIAPACSEPLNEDADYDPDNDEPFPEPLENLFQTIREALGNTRAGSFGEKKILILWECLSDEVKALIAPEEKKITPGKIKKWTSREYVEKMINDNQYRRVNKN